MNYCGIDLASKASAICLMDGMGAIVWEEEMPPDSDGFRTRLGGLEAMKPGRRRIAPLFDAKSRRKPW